MNRESNDHLKIRILEKGDCLVLPEAESEYLMVIYVAFILNIFDFSSRNHVKIF